MIAPLRPVLYAAGALAGVQLANKLRPVKLDVTDVAGSSLGRINGKDLIGDILGGRFGEAMTSLGKAGSGAASSASSSVNAQVRANIILGVVAGCVVAGLVDMVL